MFIVIQSRGKVSFPVAAFILETDAQKWVQERQGGLYSFTVEKIECGAAWAEIERLTGH